MGHLFVHLSQRHPTTEHPISVFVTCRWDLARTSLRIPSTAWRNRSESGPILEVWGNLTRPTRKPNVTGSEFRYYQQGNMRGYQHAIQNGSRVLFSFWNLSIHFISSPFWSYRQNNTYINGLEGKILTETIEFPIKIMGLKPVNFALNQSIEIFSSGYPMVFPHEIPIWWLRSKVTSRPRTPKAHHAWKEVMRLSWQFWAKP